MTNIVPLRNTGGFTRMDNQLMDGLMAINLSAHEIKVVLYVAKATLNFNEGAQRIPATVIAKATHIHPDTVSKAISGLLRHRVLFRDGGARGDIGLCDPKEWIFTDQPKQTKSPDSAQIIRIGSEPRQTETDDSLLYSKNKTPYENLPSEDISLPPPKLSRSRRRMSAKNRSAWPSSSLTTRTAWLSRCWLTGWHCERPRRPLSPRRFGIH